MPNKILALNGSPRINGYTHKVLVMQNFCVKNIIKHLIR